MDFIAREKVQGPWNAFAGEVHDAAPMADKVDQGGPNHLRAWRKFRGLTQQEIADLAEPPTTKQVYQALESGQMQLSAKWLRRLAPAFKTTPGFLLDHDPADIDAAFLEDAMSVPKERRQEARDILRVLRRG
jgi:transcriptional regulator with XRE-family HTH domain